MIVTAAVLAFLSLGGLVAWLAYVKGRPVMPWGIYGAFLGPVALPHVLLLQGESDGERRWSPVRSGLPSGVRPCPYCHAPVHAEAIACRYCGKSFYASAGEESGKEEPASPGREFEALERALARSGTKTRDGLGSDRDGTGDGDRERRADRSEERRVGKEGVSRCRDGWAPMH